MYQTIFVIFAGLKFFTENEYGIQFIFYFAFINLQIALAFFFAPIFRNVKSAQGLPIEIPSYLYYNLQSL